LDHNNQIKDEKFLKLKSKKLVIYPYSLSNNLLKEVLLKMGFKFVLTNEIRKASLIIGLKKHLKQNFKLNQFSKTKKYSNLYFKSGKFLSIK
jgi:hypothetical protein